VEIQLLLLADLLQIRQRFSYQTISLSHAGSATGVRASKAARFFYGLFYGQAKFWCKTAQNTATLCECCIVEIPSGRPKAGRDSGNAQGCSSKVGSVVRAHTRGCPLNKTTPPRHFYGPRCLGSSASATMKIAFGLNNCWTVATITSSHPGHTGPTDQAALPVLDSVAEDHA